MNRPIPEVRDPTLIPGLVLAASVGFLRLRPLGAPDLWWHLSVGRTVLDEGSRRFADRVGIPPREEFVAGEWFFDVIAYGLHQLGGHSLLVLFAALLASVACLLAWALARDVAGPSGRWTALAVTAVVAGVISVRFFPRPHVLFLCLLPACLLLARRTARSTGNAQLVNGAGLLAVVGLWAQCHPSVVLAPVLVAGAGLPWVLGRRDPGDDRRLQPRLFGLLVLVGLLPLTSPYGLGLVDQVLGHSGTDSTSHIGEMHPMPVDWWWPPQARTILLVELLAVAGLAGSCLRRRLPVGAVALAVLGLLMTLNTHRFRAAWSILMIPWVVDVLRPRLPWVEGRRSAAVALLLLVAVLCSEGRDWGGPDLGLDPVWVPTELGDAVLELGIEGPIFNDYDAGGFLGWTLYGRARVFIDGRTPPFFTDDHFYAARAALADGAVFDRLAAGYGFRAAIVPSRSPLCEHLGEDPDWTGVWRGGLRSRTIFLPRSAATRPELPEPCAQAEK